MSHKIISRINKNKNKGPAILYLVDHYGKEAIKKEFKPQRDRVYFENEVLAIEQFSEYDWFPRVYEVKDTYILYEHGGHCLFNLLRTSTLSDRYKADILDEVIIAIYNIYSQGFAHRDIHCKNILVNDNDVVKLIDWEFLAEREEGVEFIDSYDITGSGVKEGQVYAGNVYLFDNKFKFSIPRHFGMLDLDYVKNVIERYE